MIVALNFKQRFIAPIAAGTKCQTIRAPRADGRKPNIGDTLRAYTGMRTRNCALIAEGVIHAVHEIEIAWAEPRPIWIDAKPLSLQRTKAFAVDDGFFDLADMKAFFIEAHGDAVFRGHLIKWTPTR